MDGDSIRISCAILFCILGSGYFSASEIAFSSLNKIRIKNKADNGDVAAKKALKITDNFEKALVTILIGNNITNIACASLTALLAVRLWDVRMVAVATVVMTVALIFLGEVLPKSLAKAYSDSFALRTAGLLQFLMQLFSPLSWLFERIGQLASHFIRFDKQPTVTEEELVDIIKTIEDEGTIDEDQSELLQSAVEFNTTTVNDIYTPMEKVVSLSLTMSEQDILHIIQEEKYSRYPVFRNERIVGILQARQFLKNGIAIKKQSLRSLLTRIYYIDKDRPIDDLLDDMSRHRVHMAIVTANKNKVIGIVTIEDILEELVGEIWDESDEVLDYFMELGGNRYEVNGDLAVNKALDLIGYSHDGRLFKNITMADWAKKRLTLTIEEDDEFDYERLTVKVSEMQNGIIMKMIIKVNEEEA